MDCKSEALVDKNDKSVSAQFYFAGLTNEKAIPLREGLRGIYVRVNGRLLKHNFVMWQKIKTK